MPMSSIPFRLMRREERVGGTSRSAEPSRWFPRLKYESARDSPRAVDAGPPTLSGGGRRCPEKSRVSRDKEVVEMGVSWVDDPMKRYRKQPVSGEIQGHPYHQ
jgi:hypothetical protein